MVDQADMEALTRARELGIMDRVLTDAENAIYDAGMAAAYDRAAEVDAAGRFLLDRLVDHEVRMTSDEDANEWHGHVTPAMARFRTAILSLKEGKG